LRRYVALTVGDVIQFEHNHATYTFNVLTCKPNHAIAITDLDISVDFAEPLNPSPVSPNEEKPTSSFSQKANKLVEPKQALSWSYGPLVCDYSSSESEDEAEKLLRENSSVSVVGTHTTVKETDLEGIDYNECPNCRQKISTTSFWHYDRCVRLIFYCEMCSEGFPKSQYDQHMESFHTAAECPQCKEHMEKRELSRHLSDQCKMREVVCAFCEIKLVHKNKWEHESRCGAITEICPTCKVRITRIELIEHSKVCTGDPSAYKKPNYRANNTQRYDLQGDYGSQKDFSSEAFKCEHCKMPFEQFDDLEVHMLTDHADKMENM
jgi:Zn-finger nucleic acid-binding protein